MRTKLSNLDIKNAKALPTVQKLADGGGLYLEVRPTGNKIWRYRYRIDGRENIFTIGECGERPNQFGIAEARMARAEAAKLVAEGVHPRAQKRDEFRTRLKENRETFAAVAAEFLVAKKDNVTPHYFKQLEAALNRDILPVIGDFTARQVTTAQILEIIQARREVPSWAKFLRARISEIFCFAIITGRAEFDPAYPLRGKAINATGIVSRKVRNNPWLKITEVPELLAAIDAAPEGERVRKLGLRLLMLTLVRPNELAGAMWDEFDMDGAVWSVPSERMKMKGAHIVPLSRQALEILVELRTLTGDTPALFPERNARKRTGAVLTKNANMFARFITRVLGFGGRLTAHGLRATASTFLNDATRADGLPRFASDWVECQLAHVPRGVRAHYNHASYLTQRADMIQFYADSVMPRGNVIPMRKAA